MAYKFYPIEREQMYLLPPSLKDWLHKDHIVWLILDIVEGLNLTPFLEKYNKDGMGHLAYHPAMILTVLLYSYCMGERSSRKIEKLCQESVPYIIAAEVTQEENDKRQLLPMIAKTQENIRAAGIGDGLQVVLADAGYSSENILIWRNLKVLN